MDITVKYLEKTITKHIMDKYDEFYEKKDFIREEEFREKMMVLCKNENYDLNKEERGVNFLKWGLNKGYSKIVKSLLTFPHLSTSKLTKEQLKALEKLRSS